MAGDMPTAIREARRLNTILDPDTSAKIAWIQAINAAPYFAAAQFARPAKILAMPKAGCAPALYRGHPALCAGDGVRAPEATALGFDREIGQLARLRHSGDFKAMADQGVPAPALLGLAGNGRSLGALPW